MPLQGVEALVDRLHPVPLPRVPLDRLQVLLGFDHVPVDRVDRHQLAPGAHHNQKQELVPNMRESGREQPSPPPVRASLLKCTR